MQTSLCSNTYALPGWVWTSEKKQALLGPEGRNQNTLHHEFDTCLSSNTLKSYSGTNVSVRSSWRPRGSKNLFPPIVKTVARKEKSILQVIRGETASWPQDSELWRRVSRYDLATDHGDEHKAAIFSLLCGCTFEHEASGRRDSWT